MFDLSTIAANKFKYGDKETKRDTLHSICSNLTIKDKKVTLHLGKPFNVIQGAMTALVDKYDSMLEPQEKYDPVIILAGIDPQNPIWLEKWSQFRTTDWTTELDYPEYEAKEIKRFLTA